MAISPMQLPSPKAYDPNAMEQTNLQLYKDPYTVDMARIDADLLRSDREAAGEQYQHSLNRQQEYYSKALDLQAEESANELIPKLLHEQHGIGFLTGLPRYRELLGRMEQASPGLYGQYVNQAFQGEKAKALQAGGAGAYSAREAGLIVPPSEFLGATGVGTQAGNALAIDVANINAAAHVAGSGSTGGSSTIQVPIFTGPDGKEWTVSYSPGKGMDAAAIKADMIRKGYLKPDGTQHDSPPPGAVPSGNKPVAGKTNLPPNQAAPAAKPAAAGGGSGGVINEQQWDAGKSKLVTPMHREMVTQVEKARKMNGGKLLWNNGRLVGIDAQGHRQTFGVPG